MPNTLTIKLRGIALLHQVGTSWNVYLPFDRCHKVFFGFYDGDHRDPIKGAGKRITITARNTGGGSVGMPVPGPGHPEVIDLTGHYAHREGVYLRKRWAERTLFLSLNGGEYSASLTPDEYTIRPALGVGEEPLGVIGFQGEFKVQADEFMVEITDRDPTIFKDNTTIFIDNDCDRLQFETEVALDPNKTNYDFYMLYQNIVRDKNDCDLRFEVWPTRPAAPLLPCNNVRVSNLLGIEPEECPEFVPETE